MPCILYYGIYVYRDMSIFQNMSFLSRSYLPDLFCYLSVLSIKIPPQYQDYVSVNLVYSF